MKIQKKQLSRRQLERNYVNSIRMINAGNKFVKKLYFILGVETILLIGMAILILK